VCKQAGRNAADKDMCRVGKGRVQRQLVLWRPEQAEDKQGPPGLGRTCLCHSCCHSSSDAPCGEHTVRGAGEARVRAQRREIPAANGVVRRERDRRGPSQPTQLLLCPRGLAAPGCSGKQGKPHLSLEALVEVAQPVVQSAGLALELLDGAAGRRLAGDVASTAVTRAGLWGGGA